MNALVGPGEGAEGPLDPSKGPAQGVRQVRGRAELQEPPWPAAGRARYVKLVLERPQRKDARQSEKEVV